MSTRKTTRKKRPSVAAKSATPTRGVREDTAIMEFRARGKTAKSDSQRTVEFGAVRIKAGQADPVLVARNVGASVEAFDRAIGGIATPGVKIEFEKGVPRYKADPKDPSLIVRTLNGKVERGHMRAGKFVAAE